ncbi:unnamed protein product [Lactuca saligna]|uniref:proteasome endopeptidase complex n=2 Tax=Lactuca TaxID=4235 RepID=A0AA36DXR8_LACSI|nr:unnamed protein product [Lactuca saligna]
MEYNMIKSLIFSLPKWLYSHIWFSDIAIGLLIVFIFNSIVQRLTTKGPMTWPVFGILPTVLLHVTHIYEWGGEALVKSGGSFYYRGMWMGGTYGIATCDPEKIEYILKTNFKNYPKGKAYRERFYDFLGDGIFNADDELWRQQRRVANSEMHSTRFTQFSMNAIKTLVHEKLLKLLEAKKGCVIDLQDVLLRFTFDNTCAVAFGVNSGCLEVELPDIPFAKAFEQVTYASLLRFLMPPYVWKPMKFFRLGFEKTLHEAVKIVHGFAEKTVKERKMELLGNKEAINNNSRCDLLSRLIIMEQDREEVFFTDKLLQDFCISFILAGRDTSSVGLAWFFWLITKNPSVETRILEEIHNILQQRENPDKENQENTTFTEEELKKMVYLQAAITESLRLYPPVSFDHKEPQEDDMFPDGTPIEKGARIVYVMYGMARMPTIWGKDCCEFRPERWIRDGEFISESQFKYTVFNADFEISTNRLRSRSVVNSYLKMSNTTMDVPKTGFSFDLCRRNDMLAKKGLKPPGYLKTGTTIVGLIFENGVILGADTRATEGPIVADKNCEKIHYMAPNIYCCGAGTAADTEAVTDNISSQLKLHRYHTGRESRVVTALTLLKSHLFRYQGHVSAALVLGGVDVTGPHLHTIYPHGSTDTLPFATMGSGSLAAMAIFESEYREGLTRDEGVNLVTKAICSGIFNDLGSGSNVDVCVIEKGKKEYLRNHLTPNPRTYISERGYTFSKKAEVLLTRITPLKELVEVVQVGGDAMEE